MPGGETPTLWEAGAALGQLSALVFAQFQLTLGAPLSLGALGMLKPAGALHYLASLAWGRAWESAWLVWW